MHRVVNQPKLLPCVHTFCQKCLEQHTGGRRPGDKERCPLCRQEFVIPSGGIARLPGNFFIDKLVDIHKKTQCQIRNVDIIMCDICWNILLNDPSHDSDNDYVSDERTSSDDNQIDPNKVAKWQCINCGK